MYGWSFINQDQSWRGYVTLPEYEFNTTGLQEHKHLGKVWYPPTIAEKIKAFLWIYLCHTVIPVDFAGCTAGSFGSFWFPLHNETTRRNCRSLCWWVNFPRSTFTNQFHQPKPLRPRLKNAIGKTCQGRRQLATQRADNKKTQQVATEIFTRVIIRLSGFVMQRLDYKKRVFLQEDSQTWKGLCYEKRNCLDCCWNHSRP